MRRQILPGAAELVSAYPYTPVMRRRRFPARGPLFFWNLLPMVAVVSGLAALFASWQAGLAVAVVGIVGGLMLRRVFAVDVAGDIVRIGRRFTGRMDDVVAIEATVHRWARGEPVSLRFCFADGSTMSWPWLSYGRSTFAILADAAILPGRHQRFLDDLAQVFCPHGTRIDVPWYEEMPTASRGTTTSSEHS